MLNLSEILGVADVEKSIIWEDCTAIENISPFEKLVTKIPDFQFFKLFGLYVLGLFSIPPNTLDLNLMP